MKRHFILTVFLGICLQGLSQEARFEILELKPPVLTTRVTPPTFYHSNSDNLDNIFTLKHALDSRTQQNNPIDLKMDFYFKSFPLRDHYVNGRYFMTTEGAYIPPYHIENQYLIIHKEKNKRNLKRNDQ